MCNTRSRTSRTVSNQFDSLCGKSNCELTKKRGVWICCCCRHGYKGSDRNRYGTCQSCRHEVCEDCKAWNRDTVAQMKAEDEVNGNEGGDSEADTEEEVEYEESDVSSEE